MLTQMEIEILEQPHIISELIKEYVQNYVVTIPIPTSVKKIVLVGSGSSYNCSLLAKWFFDNMAQVDTKIFYSGELLNDSVKIDPDAMYFFTSQSGETYDTICAFNKAKEAQAKTFAIVNNNNSTLYNNADFKIDIKAGVESSIASTKAFTGSLMALYLCAVKIGANGLKNIGEYVKNIYEIEKHISNALDLTLDLDKAVNFLHKEKDIQMLASNINYAAVKECALKVKETSYIDCNPHFMGEFLHGHLAILNKSNTVLSIITRDCSEFEKRTYEKLRKENKIKSVVITDCARSFDCEVEITFPRFESKITKMLALIMIVQMLALKIALKLKRDVDKPKGLSKVVN